MGYSVGRRVAELRERKGLSISELAKLSGISKSTLWEIENDKISPTVSTLWSIANALGVTFGELIAYDIVVKDEGIEVRLIERRDNIEVYLMKLEPGAVRLAAGHENSPVEVVHVIKGAMIAGPAESPYFLWSGETAKFYGGVDHVYVAVGGDAAAVVTMRYFSEPTDERVLYVDTRRPAIDRYRDVISAEGVRSGKLAKAIEAVNGLSAEGGDGLTLDVLSSEFKTLAGAPTLPKAILEMVERAKGTGDGGELRLIYEPLRPGYAEEAVYAAYELERRGVGEAIAIGCGPAYREAMLEELISIDVTCAEASGPFRELSLVRTIDELPRSLDAAVVFDLSRRAGSSLKAIAERLRRGGVLLISDSFIDAYSSERARRRNVIRHHLAYLLDVAVEYKDVLLSAYNAAESPKLSLRALSRAYYEIYKEVRDEPLTVDARRALLNFHVLELTSLFMGVARAEDRTHVEGLVARASALGLRLESHYKVYSTSGGKMGGGTHVLAFVKA